MRKELISKDTKFNYLKKQKMFKLMKRRQTKVLKRMTKRAKTKRLNSK